MTVEFVKCYSVPKHVTDPETGAAKTEFRDWIVYTQFGERKNMTVHRRVSEFQKIRWTGKPNRDVPAQMMKAKWDALKPHYEAWKNGNPLPETGTALIAWSGITDGQRQKLAEIDIKSVEGLAEATDNMLDRIQLHNKHALREAAKDWLIDREGQVAREEAARRKAELEAMQADRLEMMQMMAEMKSELDAMKSDKGDQPAKRGRKPLPRDDDGNIIRDEAAA